MRSKLQPCAACARHIRASEGACPFCGVSQEARVETLSQLATAGVVGLALALGACETPKTTHTAPPPVSVPAPEAPKPPPTSTASTKPASTPVEPKSEPAASLPVVVAPTKEPKKTKKEEATKPPEDRRAVPAYGGPRPDPWREVKPMYGLPALPPELEDRPRKKR